MCSIEHFGYHRLRPLSLRNACIFIATLLLTTGLASAQVNLFKDWAIACDNTVHCEAVGFQPEDEFDNPVSLWLARDAGPDAPVTARLMAIAADGQDPVTLSITAGGVTLTGLAPEQDIPDTESLRRLLQAMLAAPNAVVSDGRRTWTLSLSGITATLLKMDDRQGRVGTPGALVRPGDASEASVPPPMPAPTVRAATLPTAQPGDEALIVPILAAVEDRSCWESEPDDAMVGTAIARLSDSELLVLRDCWRGPYQSAAGAWVAHDTPPYAPRRVLFPTADGATVDEVVNAEFADGELFSYSKGRGIGDCINTANWVWTGTDFALIHATEAPLCRGIAGGGFPLRTWTAEVVR